MNIKPGDKVICTGNFNNPQATDWYKEKYPDRSFPNGFPENGKIYAVKGIRHDGGLILCGVPAIQNGNDCGWNSSGFQRIIPFAERPKQSQDEVLDLYLQGTITQEEMQQKMLDIQKT